MYGLVNLAVQQLVTEKFGAAVWAEIKRKVALQTETFNRMQAYPDSLTFNMVGAVCEVTGLSAEQVLFAFGEYWVLYTGNQGYGHLFEMAGSSLRDFLHNLDNLHSRVGQNFTQLRPPSFVAEDLDAQTVRLHYHTERSGLCSMVFGLINGLARRFGVEATVTHPECRAKGGEQCIFDIKITNPEALS
jgi:predicted hydrocarbon binding protein